MVCGLKPRISMSRSMSSRNFPITFSSSARTLVPTMGTAEARRTNVSERRRPYEAFARQKRQPKMGFVGHCPLLAHCGKNRRLSERPGSLHELHREAVSFNSSNVELHVTRPPRAFPTREGAAATTDPLRPRRRRGARRSKPWWPLDYPRRSRAERRVDASQTRAVVSHRPLGRPPQGPAGRTRGEVRGR